MEINPSPRSPLEVAADLAIGAPHTWAAATFEHDSLLDELMDELDIQEVPVRREDCASAERVFAACAGAQEGALLLVCSALSDSDLHQLNLLRESLKREGPTLVLAPLALMRRFLLLAPHWSAWFHSVVSLDSGAADFADEKERTLERLRQHHAMSDEQFLAAHQSGELQPSPDHAVWLVLLGEASSLD